YQPDRRLLISGDHLLGRVSLYFEIGFTPDPVGEFLHSLDIADGLDARLALAGHARPFTDIEGHVQGNRDLVARRLDDVRAALARLDPTFVSVTYGAGGSAEQKQKTIEIVSRIKANHGLEAMAHFTCVGASVDDLRATLDRMRDAGIENVLALRGDPPAGVA